MKCRNNVQLYSVPQNITTGNKNSIEKVSEVFYLPDAYSPDKPGQLLRRPDGFYDLGPGTQLNQYDTTLFPVVKDGPFTYENPVQKVNSINATFKPAFNDYLKQTAAWLSDIELALDCYDLSNLQVSTHALKDLFFDMKMPAVYQLAVKMEELAREYQLQGVKDLLRAIKKVIGQVVKHRMLPGD